MPDLNPREPVSPMSVRDFAHKTGLRTSTAHRVLTGEELSLTNARLALPFLKECPCCGRKKGSTDAFEKEALEAADQRRKLTDPEHVKLSALRPIWKKHGGDWHGPRIETWTIPEDNMEAFFNEALSALSAALQEPVEVKPLEWEDARFCDTPRETAESPFGTYEVLQWAHGDFGGSVPANDPDDSNTEFGGASSMEEAKAAAQAHHVARVRAMLADRG